METRFRENEYSGGIKEMRSTDYRDVAQEKKTNAIVTYRKKYLMLSKESVATILFRSSMSLNLLMPRSECSHKTSVESTKKLTI